MLKETIKKNRSYRRFNQDFDIGRENLLSLVELAIMSPSAANLQPLKYVLVNTPEKNESVFATLSWAGYLQDWPGPEDGEKPSAYIIIMGDTEINNAYFQVDAGIACQSMLLGAVDQGLGGCILGSIDRGKLKQSLSIPDRYNVLYIVALGKPEEKVVLEPLAQSGDIKYYRDSKQIHHVPKRALDEVILGY